jgi:hypothetical protein
MSPMFALYIAYLFVANEKSVVINFRDPNYSADDGGYNPVEILKAAVELINNAVATLLGAVYTEVHINLNLSNYIKSTQDFT